MYGLEFIGIVYGSGREFWASFDRGFASVFALFCLHLPGLEGLERKTLNPINPKSVRPTGVGLATAVCC